MMQKQTSIQPILNIFGKASRCCMQLVNIKAKEASFGKSKKKEEATMERDNSKYTFKIKKANLFYDCKHHLMFSLFFGPSKIFCPKAFFLHKQNKSKKNHFKFLFYCCYLSKFFKNYSTKVGMLKPLSVADLLLKIEEMCNRDHSSSAILKNYSTSRVESTNFLQPEIIACLNRLFESALYYNDFSFWNSQIFINFVERIISKIPSFNSDDTYKLLFSFARVHHIPDKLLHSVIYSFINEEERTLSFKDFSLCQISHLAVILSSYSSFTHRSSYSNMFLKLYCENLVSRLLHTKENSFPAKENQENYIHGKHLSFSLKEINYILLGLSNMAYRDLQTIHMLIDYLYFAVLLNKFKYSNQNNNNILRNIKADNPKIFNAVEISHLSTIFLSMSTLGIKHTAAYQEIFTIFADVIDNLTSSDLSNLMLGVATLWRDSSTPFPLFLLSEINRITSSIVSNFELDESILIAWCFCCTELYKSSPHNLILILKHIFLDSLNFNSFLKKIKQSQQKSRQICQIFLTILLEKDSNALIIKQELERLEIFNPLKNLYLDLIQNHSETADEMSQCSKEILEDLKNFLLENEREVKNLIYSVLKKNESKQEMSIREEKSEINEKCFEEKTELKNIYIRSNLLINNFYRGQIAIICDYCASDNSTYSTMSCDRDYISTNNSDCRVLTTKEITVNENEKAEKNKKKLKILIEIDDYTYEDFSDILDPFIALKFMHLNILEWNIVRICLSEWNRIESMQDKVTYIRNSIY